jgi:hypothetical protein
LIDFKSFFNAYTQKNNYSINNEAKFLEHEHIFFKSILILEQFYKAKKKKEGFLSIKTPHENILA